MNQLLFYLLQVVVASGLLYGYYHLVLRNKKFHRYNRFFLLAAVVISIGIPFLNIPVYFTKDEAASSAVIQTLQVISSTVVEESPVSIAATPELTPPREFATLNLIYIFYLAILLFFLLRVLVSILKIRTLILTNTTEKIDKIKFVNTNEPGTPFSFFRWLFWNRKIELNSEKGEQIFRHELFHIQQKHSWDIIFMEMISTIFWINPFFHLMQKELKAIHEFLADEFAITENRHWQYAELLLMQVLNTNNHLVNPFFHNQIKRRITMITSSSKPSYRYLRKLMVLPVAAMIIFLFAFNYKNGREPYDVERAGKRITIVVDAGHGGTDPGAKTKDGKYNEAQLTFELAKQIGSLAPEYNIDVVLTREDENFSGGATNKNDALKKTVELVNNIKPDAFISIHMNTTSSGEQNLKSGIDAYITSKRDNHADVQLASAVLHELNQVYTTSKDIRKRNEKGIFVVDKQSYPSILLECGYINNQKDISFITDKSNREKIARAILKGIVSFANNNPGGLRSYFEPGADTSKLMNKALVIINGAIQEKRGLRNIDTSIFYGNPLEFSLKTIPEKEAIVKYGTDGREGAVEISFDRQGKTVTDTIPKVDTIYWVKDLPHPEKKSPTHDQLSKWSDPKMYGVWLDGKRINNSELTKYKPADFGLFYASKLAKNAINYGKHYYQINLYTHEYYAQQFDPAKPPPKMLIREIITDSAIKMSSPLVVINDKQMPGLTIESLNSMIPVDSIISITSLDKEAAKKKYGIKAEHGAIEVKTKSWGPFISPIMRFDSEERVVIDAKNVQDNDNKVFVKVETEPSFPGGHEAWNDFLRKNINSIIPVEKGAPPGTYTVILQFIIDKQGNLSDLRALTTHGYGMEEEALRVIKLSGKWEPAIQNKHKVTAYKKQPVTFVVMEDTKNESLSSKGFDPSTMNFNDAEFKRKWQEMIAEIKAIAWKEGKAAYVYKGRTYVFGKIVNTDPTVASFTEQNGTDHVFLLDDELVNSVTELNKLIKRSDVKKFGFIKKEEALKRFNRNSAIVFIETDLAAITRN